MAVYLVAPVISGCGDPRRLRRHSLSAIAGAAQPPSIWDPLIGGDRANVTAALWVLAVSSLAVYGIVLGGWAHAALIVIPCLGPCAVPPRLSLSKDQPGTFASVAQLCGRNAGMVGIIHGQLAQGYWFYRHDAALSF